MGVAQVLVPTDSERRRSGAVDPVEAAIALGRERELTAPVRELRPGAALPSRGAAVRPVLSLPELRRYEVSSEPGLVRVEPRDRATVLEGDADGVTALAGLGALDPPGALLYGADVGREELRDLVEQGARIVLTDSSRRRACRLRARVPTAARRCRSQRRSRRARRATRRSARAAGRRDGGGVLHARAALRTGAAGVQPVPRAPCVRRLRRPPRHDLAGRPDPPARRPLRGGHAPRAAAGGRDRGLPARRPARRDDARGGDVQRRRPARAGRGSGGHPGGGPGASCARCAWRSRRPGATGRCRVRGPRRDPRAGAHGGRVAAPAHVACALGPRPRPVAQRDRHRARADYGRLPAPSRPRAGPPQRIAARRWWTRSGTSSARWSCRRRGVRRLRLGEREPVRPGRGDRPARGRGPGLAAHVVEPLRGRPGRRASSAFDRDPRTAWIGDLSGAAAGGSRGGRRGRCGCGGSCCGRVRWSTRAPRRFGCGSRVASRGSRGWRTTGRWNWIGPCVDAAFGWRWCARRDPASARGACAVCRSLRSRLRGCARPRRRRDGRFRTRCGECRWNSVSERSPLAVSGPVADLDDGAAPPRRGAAAARCRSPRAARCSVPRRARSCGPTGCCWARRPRTRRHRGRARRARQVGVRRERDGRARARGAHGAAPVVAHPRPELLRRLACHLPRRIRPRARPRRAEADRRLRQRLAGRARLHPGDLQLPSATACDSRLHPVGDSHPRSPGDRRTRMATRAPRSTGPPRTRDPRPATPPSVARRARRFSSPAAIAVAGGLLFALRAGAVLGPLAFLALSRGITVRRLLALAFAAVALLPVIYLVFEPKNPGGYSFTYASDLLGAHWVATFAVSCLAAASILMALQLRRADHAVPGDELAHARDADQEREPRPVARLDPIDP